MIPRFTYVKSLKTKVASMSTVGYSLASYIYGGQDDPFELYLKTDYPVSSIFDPPELIIQSPAIEIVPKLNEVSSMLPAGYKRFVIGFTDIVDEHKPCETKQTRMFSIIGLK